VGIDYVSNFKLPAWPTDDEGTMKRLSRFHCFQAKSASLMRGLQTTLVASFWNEEHQLKVLHTPPEDRRVVLKHGLCGLKVVRKEDQNCASKDVVIQMFCFEVPGT